MLRGRLMLTILNLPPVSGDLFSLHSFRKQRSVQSPNVLEERVDRWKRSPACLSPAEIECARPTPFEALRHIRGLEMLPNVVASAGRGTLERPSKLRTSPDCYAVATKFLIKRNLLAVTWDTSAENCTIASPDPQLPNPGYRSHEPSSNATNALSMIPHKQAPCCASASQQWAGQCR